MYNYKLLLGYDGAKYKGWQRLKEEDKTIQYKIESMLTKWTQEDIKIVASGRTDAGVHARGQVANFWTEQRFSAQEVHEALNEYLPDDICCMNVECVDENFHSRYNAKAKTYEYTIQVGKWKDPFERQFSWYVGNELYLKKMRKAAVCFIGEHDFTSYTNLKSKKKSKVKTIDSINIEEVGNLIKITYTGNGFLQHMLRILTGTLVEVGLGNLKVEEVLNILDQKKRDVRCPLAPGQGLCLMEVEY